MPSVEIDAGLAGFTASVGRMPRIYGAAVDKMEGIAQASERRLTALRVDAERDRETAAVRIHRETAAKLAQIDEMTMGGPRTQAQAEVAAAIQARAARDLVAISAPAAAGAKKVAAATAVLSTSSAAAAAGVGNLGRGLSMVGIQMPDVVQGLMMGANPLQVLAQQGLQVGQ